MTDRQNGKPTFWHKAFITAFVLGAVLWVLWMTKVIQQTRERRDSGFFVPMATNPPESSSAAPEPADVPARQTNSTATGNK